MKNARIRFHLHRIRVCHGFKDGNSNQHGLAEMTQGAAGGVGIDGDGDTKEECMGTPRREPPLSLPSGSSLFSNPSLLFLFFSFEIL